MSNGIILFLVYKRKIDELGRIVVPKEIRKNLNIRNGEDVQIYVEDDKIILKKYQKMGSIKENAQKYLDMFGKFISSDILVTDREKIISSSLESYLNKGIDSKVISLINDRRQDVGRGIKLDNSSVDKYYLVVPIIVDADAIGALILLSDKDINDLDKVIINILSSLLSLELY